MLDRDLAALYGVTTGNLNKAVQRNSDRFPADFTFQLTDDETADLVFQFGRSRRHGGSRFNPYVFTQEGVAKLSNVLRSPRAVHSLSASTGERVRVRCRFGILHPPAHDTAGETAPRNWLSRHPQGRRRPGQSESKTKKQSATLHQQSTLNCSQNARRQMDRTLRGMAGGQWVFEKAVNVKRLFDHGRRHKQVNRGDAEAQIQTRSHQIAFQLESGGEAVNI